MSRFDRVPASLGLLVGLLASIANVAGAQTLAALPSNARIRVDFPPAERAKFRRGHAQSVVGTLEAVHSDTLLLVVRAGSEALRIPRAALRGVYVSGGRPPRWRAALEGALLPALITGALSAVGSSIHRKQGDPSPSAMALSSAAWAGASGALLGAWSPKERWRPIASVAMPVPATR